ncbi:MAG: hypothetical protein FJY83_11475 [Candidatus Aminicenantes bacterium]|nr:hypothetical protein [Candidatus Aminicenantes bacterium]
MEKQQKPHPVMSVKDVLLLIGGALLLIVIFQNIKAHEFRIFFWKLWVSPLLLILIMAGAGFLAGWLVARRRYKNKAAKAAAKAAPPAPPAPSAPPAGDNRPLA